MKENDGRKNNGGRPGCGRKKKEPTETTTFRVNKEALEICRAAKVKLNFNVNKLVVSLAKDVKE